jgi:hypothetical protein
MVGDQVLHPSVTAVMVVIVIFTFSYRLEDCQVNWG